MPEMCFNTSHVKLSVYSMTFIVHISITFLVVGDYLKIKYYFEYSVHK